MLNVEGRINGDPSVPVALSDDGRKQARRLGDELEDRRHIASAKRAVKRLHRLGVTATAPLALLLYVACATDGCD